MAKKKSFTRVVVEIGGHLSRVFTIRENNTGSLTLMMPGRGTHGYLGGREAQIDEYRYSIHPSDQSRDGVSTVHQTTVFLDGAIKKDLFLTTTAVRNNRFQPIIVRTLIDPRLNPALTPHKRDTVVSLGAFNPARTETMYAIWCSSPERAEGFPRSPHYSCASIRFDRFSVFIPHVFWPRASSPHSPQKVYGTTRLETMTGAEAAAGHHAGNAVGAGPQQAMNVVIADFQTLDRNIDRLRRQDWATPSGLDDEHWSEPLGFTAKPEP